MVTQKERVSASIVILQQMVSPCGLIAVLHPQYFGWLPCFGWLRSSLRIDLKPMP